MSVVVRFAPSPTGYLHIGGARTALFNWLFARHHGGTFLLRIEDTDRERSTDAAVAAIFDGLGWLEIAADAPPVFQLARAPRHREVAERLLAEGKAYHCYATPAELEAMREAARRAGQPMRYDGRWRDRDPAEAPPGVRPVVRLKMPTAGETVIEDLVQGTVKVANAQLDDMVLLRSDGTPTYMHSVVVDDIDMEITHVIRGDDHLTNAFRQTQLYAAIGAPVPRFAHLPLIHGPDGAKLSKRHGALSVTEYRDMGFLAEGLCNYLVRLGWSHGDEEIMSSEQAIAWFDVDAVGRSPSRFDMAKLLHVNAHHLRLLDTDTLLARAAPFLAGAGLKLEEPGRGRLLLGLDGIKQRSRTLVELARGAAIYLHPRPLPVDAKALELLTEEVLAQLAGVTAALADVSFEAERLEQACRAVAQAQNVGFGKLAQPIRVALTGSTVSPGLFEVMVILGRAEVLGRLEDAIARRNPTRPGVD